MDARDETIDGKVYLIMNKINGKGYVGKTKRVLSQRLKEHVQHAKLDHIEMPLYAAIRKYGIDAFEIKILQECSTPEDLNVAEKEWIKNLGTFEHGYNATLGGDGVSGWSPSTEHRQSIREANLGEKNHNFGKTWGKTEWTQEERDELAEKNRNPEFHKPRTSEEKAVIGIKSTTYGKQPIAVRQLTVDGFEVKIYRSIAKAAKAVRGLGSVIKKCCVVPNRTYKGYRWEYVLKPVVTLIAKCDLAGNVLQTYRLVTDAARDLGRLSYKSGISKVLCGHRVSCAGYIWKYVVDREVITKGE